MSPKSMVMGRLGQFGRPWSSCLVVLGVLVSAGATRAADVTRPAAVSEVLGARVDDDVHLEWQPTTGDVNGGAEQVDHYRIYRGTTPDFIPDTLGGTNRVGTSSVAGFEDVGAAASGGDYFYLVTAVDAAGNESGARPSRVSAPPALSGYWTETTIQLQWTAAEPNGEVLGYRVYYGPAPRAYTHVVDVGLVNSHTLAGLQTYRAWYAAVTAIDAEGNESPFSNEHVDAVAGRVRIKAHDEDYLCWEGPDSCPPDPGEIKRNGGWQHLVPVDFPPGEWTRILVTYTMDSRLCSPPAQGTVSKCGDTNPGGWNPCGDPWDRLAHLFLVLDDCIESGTSCIQPGNLELIRAISPFGTDAPPPNGTGAVPPRALTLDVTPYRSLLTGTRWIGAEIVNFTQAGWYVSVDFELSKRPDEISPKPPADGLEVVGFGSAPLAEKLVHVPISARKVYMRLFTSGHGGSLACDGGSNNGGACTSGAQCPGGSCQPCDEFCHRTNRVLRNGSPVIQFVPWRTDCSPSGTPCFNWNACGYPSCTFPRAGWCPGYIACHTNPPCDQDIEVTDLFAPGGSYNIGYDVLVQRGSWPVSLALFWYE